MKRTSASDFADQFSRQLLSAVRGPGLSRIQWCALRYYACADKKARTIQGFAAAQAISRGRALQIIGQLRRKRLLSCRPRIIARAESIKVTAAGTRLLRRDPQLLMRAALVRLSVAERRALLTVLKRASAALARSAKLTMHLFLVAGASLFGYTQVREQQAPNALTQSAWELLARLA